MANRDPLAMGDLDPGAINAAVEAKSKGKVKPPSELDLKKEERLAVKEQRLAARVRPMQPPPPPVHP